MILPTRFKNSQRLAITSKYKIVIFFCLIIICTFLTKEPHTLYRFWFLIFVLVWTSSFFLTFGRLALSLCYAKWYFTPEKDEGNSVSMLSCTLTTMVKHAGTVAFASLALGPIAVIRAPFSILQNCIKRSGMHNICIDAIICSCQCSFFVMERFLKFSSRNIFTQTAVFGYSFCKGSHESYYLMKRNAESVSDAGPVGFLCTFYTRIFLCSVICLGSYFALDMFYANDLFSIMSVIAMIGFISWFTVGFFTEYVQFCPMFSCITCIVHIFISFVQNFIFL